jgi:uncharacterized membrane protein
MRRYQRRNTASAIFTAVIGVAMIVFAWTFFPDHDGFVKFWIAIAAAITIYNVWSALSPRGDRYQAPPRDDPDRDAFQSPDRW